MPGLIDKDTKLSLILTSSSICANINGFVSGVLATLTYHNQLDHEIEGLFVYDNGGGIVTSLNVTVGHRKLRLETRDPSSEISQENSESVEENSQDGFAISIGKIPANVEVVLAVNVLGELQTTNGEALLFKIPRVFTPFGKQHSSATSAQHSQVTDLGSGSCITTEQPYAFDLKICAAMPCLLAGCFSQSHAIRVDADADATSAETVVITLAEEYRYDREIEILFYPSQPLEPFAAIEPGVSLKPRVNEPRCCADFSSDGIIAVSYMPDLSNGAVFGEFVFMVDRSGSMSGSHICNAKEGLVLFLKSLPTTAYFNVVSFGSYSRTLFQTSQPYNQENLEKGCAYVNSIRADMGGSDLLQPLKEVLEQPLRIGYTRNIFLLTDGDVSHPKTIIKYLRRTSTKSRIFTFGIGPKISHNVVCCIARAGQGKAFFPSHVATVQKEIVKCLKETLKPTLCNIKVDWELPDAFQIHRSCQEIAFAPHGQRMNLFASVALPPRMRHFGNPGKDLCSGSGGVKEFWFDEDFDSCQLGDNVFHDDQSYDSDFPRDWSSDSDTDICSQCSDYEPRLNGSKARLCTAEIDPDELSENNNHVGNAMECEVADDLFITEKNKNIEYTTTGYKTTSSCTGDVAAATHASADKDGKLQTCATANPFSYDYQKTSDIIDTEEMAKEDDSNMNNNRKNSNSSSITTSNNCHEVDDDERNIIVAETHCNRLSTSSNSGNHNQTNGEGCNKETDDDSNDPQDLPNERSGKCHNLSSSSTLSNTSTIMGDINEPSITEDVNVGSYNQGTARYRSRSSSLFTTPIFDRFDTSYQENRKKGKRLGLERQEEIRDDRLPFSTYKYSISNELTANQYHHFPRSCSQPSLKDLYDEPPTQLQHSKSCRQVNRDYNTPDFKSPSRGRTSHLLSLGNTQYSGNSDHWLHQFHKRFSFSEEHHIQLGSGSYPTAWASVILTGFHGPDVYRKRIPFRLRPTENRPRTALCDTRTELHQIASLSFIRDMQSTLNETEQEAAIIREIIHLSTTACVPSMFTVQVVADEHGHIVGTRQDSLYSATARRHRPPLSTDAYKYSAFSTSDDQTPVILVSCPSVDEDPRSPTKRRHGATIDKDNTSDEDGKYYRLERLAPEGCDQAKPRTDNVESHRTRLVDFRNIPMKAIQRRQLVSARLILLTRKMKNARKLNVFAGPPFIRLILLQSAEGFWQLTYSFARIVGLPLVQLELAAPFADCTMIPLGEQDGQLGIDCYYDSLALWATAVALVYLKKKWKSHEEKWELVAMKAELWLKRQTFPQGFSCQDVMLAARQAIVLLEQKYRSRAKSEPVGLIG